MKFLSNITKGLVGFFTNNEKGSPLWLLEQFFGGLVKTFIFLGRMMSSVIADKKGDTKD